MTELRESISAAARQVISDLSETWKYRKRTSTGAASEAFTPLTDFACHPTNRTSSETWDEEHRAWIKRDRMRIRVRDDSTPLVPGDQVFDLSGAAWAVVGVLSCGPGSIAYDITKESALMQQVVSRHGGV